MGHKHLKGQPRGPMKFRLSSQELPHGRGGGRWRIRTPVSGSEGRKDIQTTLIARISPESPPLLEEGG